MPWVEWREGNLRKKGETKIMKKVLFTIVALVMAIGLAIPMAMPAMATVTGNLLNNPGAETGTMSSWATTGNAATLTSIVESTGTVEEYTGTYFFTMGMGPGPSSMSQNIDLTTLGGTPLSFEAGGWVQTEYYWNGMPPWGNVPDPGPGHYDKGKLIVEFFDSSTVSLGQFVLDPVEHPVLGSSMGGRDYTQFMLSDDVPANAVSATYKLEGYLIQGVYINVFLDDLYFKVNIADKWDVTINAEADGSPLAGVPISGTYDTTDASGTTPYTVADIPDSSSMELTAPLVYVDGSGFYVFSHWKVGEVDKTPGQLTVTFDVTEDTTATAVYAAATNFVTGGGNIKSGKKITWTFGGNVGFDEVDGIVGQFEIVDHTGKGAVSWHCHNDFSSLVFSGPPIVGPPGPSARHSIATFTGTFTSNKGDTATLTVEITDVYEPGQDNDTIVVTGSFEFSGNPISGGNFQIHEGLGGPVVRVQ
jgi:hypothetical protein